MAVEARDERAKINYAEFNIAGSQFNAMDHGFGGDFTFNEAFSLMVLCDNQSEIDKYWEKL
ncbi:MAG: VOC family protein, partial [Syntrophomonas sp.]